MSILQHTILTCGVCEPNVAGGGGVHVMANTYTQIYIQVVFAVQARHCLIHPEH
jgi:hypothetical protein